MHLLPLLAQLQEGGLPGVGAAQFDYPLVDFLPVHFTLRPSGRGDADGGGGAVSARRVARGVRHCDGGRARKYLTCTLERFVR